MRRNSAFQPVFVCACVALPHRKAGEASEAGDAERCQRWFSTSLPAHLLGGLADRLASSQQRLAGSQQLLLPYLVAAAVKVGGRGRGGAVFTRRVAGSECPSATEQTQFT